MKVLVLGSGGREHALAYRMSLDPQVSEVLVFPGNPGMASTAKLRVCGGQVSLQNTFDLVNENQIELVVIGPEKYLFEGYVDELQKAGIAAFGPSKAASFLEESKIESKLFMKEFGIPTTDFEVARDLASANQAIDAHPNWAGYVLKLSGPALGKGVIVTKTQAEAKAAAAQFFEHKPAGIEEGMVIEERFTGREVSLFYVCSKNEFRFVASACDHKRLNDNDEGPNTGGMGAYSPCTWIDSAFLVRVENEIVIPTLEGMMSHETPFTGMLFVGLMVNERGFSLLEYNTRFGDPETQTFLPILKGDFTGVLKAAAQGQLAECDEKALSTNGAYSLHVVKAAKGYPGLFGTPIESGKPIQMGKQAGEWKDAQLFYAGVKEDANLLLTSGGRVLGVTGVGSSFEAARDSAYSHTKEVTFSGEHYRTDIGGVRR